MLKNELHKFIFVTVALSLSLVLDIAVGMTGAPFWYLYSFGGGIDYLAAFLITILLRENNTLPPYIHTIVKLQKLAVLTHMVGLLTHILYVDTGYMFIAIMNDLYEIVLIGILVAELVALWKGGNGLYNRRRNRQNDANIAPSIVYSADYTGPRCQTGYQREE